MKFIQLTLQIDGRQSAEQLAGFLEGAAEHLMDTYNDLNRIKKITWEIPPTTPKRRRAAPTRTALDRQVVSALEDWRDECDEILGNVSTEEERESYTMRRKEIKALIEELRKGRA